MPGAIEKNGEDPSGMAVLNATPAEAGVVRSILGLLPACVLDAAGVRRVVIAPELGATHGASVGGGEIRIHPKMLPGGVKTKLGHGARWPHLYFTVLHEVGHALDDRYHVSLSEEWLRLSDWRHEPETMGEPSAKGRGRYIEKRPGWPEYTSPWTHAETGRPFIRQYQHKGPEDDFSDHFAYFFLSPKAFALSEALRRKHDFLGRFVERLCYTTTGEFDQGTAYDVPVARPMTASHPDYYFWRDGGRTREQIQTTGIGITGLPPAPNWYSGERIREPEETK